MFRGKDSILKLIDAFRERKVQLYHACQLKDLESYLKLGGIPARGLLADSSLSFTGFKSDENDKKTGDWNRVFLNLNDFGNFFHNGANSTPNVYGPILFKLDPDCLEDSVDIAVCLCSAGSDGYKREDFSISSIEDIEKLFAHAKNDKYRSTWLKDKNALRSLFPDIPVKGAPEISCTVSSRLISLDYVTSVVVDPLDYGGYKLYDVVKSQLSGHHKILGTMARRSTKNPAKYNSLITAVAAGCNRVDDLATSDELRGWAEKIAANDLSWQFERFAVYLKEGTLNALLKPSAA